MKNDYKPAKLIEYKRGSLTEHEHWGFIVHINKNGIINKIGEDNNYKFYHRSCMKPLQASVMTDLGLDDKYGFTLEETALFCASHTGELVHQEKINSALKKINMTEKNLLCPPILPLSKEENERLIRQNLSASKIHNNCSGKHTLMLAVCLYKGFPLDNYTDINHPLTDFIVNKVCDLCEVSPNEVIINKDGCTLPVIATSLESLAKGYLNLFTDKKYKKIKDAFRSYPYLIGGKNRLDSDIMINCDNLAVKVGASGLCVAVNLEKEEAIAVKMSDADTEARAYCVINALMQLKWPEPFRTFSDRIKKIYKEEILSQGGDVLGKISPCFSLCKSFK